jgi:cytochrome P450
VQISPGGLVFEDPPVHDCRRRMIARVFTPRRMEALEPRVRQFCRRSLEPLAGAERFDFLADLAAQIPLYVIGMLLGIPERDLDALRERTDGRVRTEAKQFPDWEVDAAGARLASTSIVRGWERLPVFVR